MGSQIHARFKEKRQIRREVERSPTSTGSERDGGDCLAWEYTDFEDYAREPRRSDAKSGGEPLNDTRYSMMSQTIPCNSPLSGTFEFSLNTDPAVDPGREGGTGEDLCC